MIRLFAIAALALVLVGCEHSAERQQRSDAKPVPVADSTRFTVERVSVFHDALAYDSQRGIYVITDSHTGKEYVGVSGIGIAEIGSHLSGKVQVSDER